MEDLRTVNARVECRTTRDREKRTKNSTSVMHVSLFPYQLRQRQTSAMHADDGGVSETRRMTTRLRMSKVTCIKAHQGALQVLFLSCLLTTEIRTWL